MQIISYSLWGNTPKYTIGAIKNAELAQSIYPGWISRFYVSRCVPESILTELNSIYNTQVILVDDEANWSGMFWRFRPAFDNNTQTVIIRDTDSRLSFREKIAVDEWLTSDKDFHIMRDHPFHNTYIMGGMWGCRNNILNKLNIIMQIPENNNFWQVDQNFLRDYVYNKVKEYSFIHDSYRLMGEPNAKSFPCDRINNGFVGEIYDEFNYRHSDHYTLL